jgi:predicted TIM-barrel fold metal-dependent hydrolase
MTRHGVSVAMLSITAPGPCIFSDSIQAAKLARQTNIYAAELRDRYPDKFGVFASLPSILDKDLALKELAFAYDELKVDGVLLFTRYGTGHHYLGHPDFKDIWDELDRRKAVILVHPTAPVDNVGINPKVPVPIIQYPFETTKAAIDLITSKTARTHKNCKIILSHAGGVLPFYVERPAIVLPTISDEFTYDDFIEDARNFYYDTAVVGAEGALACLQKFAKPDHILFGSDWCYAKNVSLDHHVGGLDRFRFDDTNMLQNINRNNALKLFPRLAAFSGCI